MKNEKAIVLLSGGLDSATCLYWAKSRFSLVYAITFNYKDRGKGEKSAAVKIARSAMPDYDSRLSAYVPARNLMFYSIALYYAENMSISSIVGGHNRHDAVFFKDASQSYMQKLTRLFNEGSKMQCKESTKIILPLCKMYRKKIIMLAVKLGVPIKLTWSCHRDGNTHCGSCYACIERLQSFASLGINDPAFPF